MVHIESRPGWGAVYRDGDISLGGLAEEVAVHHTATATPRADVDVEVERAIMRELERTGFKRFGVGISYNALVFPSGRPYQGVSFNRRGTHTGGNNSRVRAVCFVGNYEIDEPTPAALATAAAIIAEGRGLWWRAGAPVKGHRSYTSTACPGRNVAKHLAYLATSGGGPTPVAHPLPGAPAASARNPRPFGADVRRGDHGPGVLEVQRILAGLGFYAGDHDGSAGPQTDAAIRAFQLAAFGPAGVDGSFGPASRAAAAVVPPFPGYSIEGTSGEDTRAFQRRLRDRGYVLDDDASHGPTTSRRMRAFQADKGLTADANGGPQTWVALWVRPIT